MIKLLFFIFFSHLFAEKECVLSVKLEGLNQTSKSWLLSYLELKEEGNDFCAVPPSLLNIETKLLTTGVFKTVNASVDDRFLLIKVEEKWTFIPVFRAAYGGGLPLVVIGAYNTHTFGRLLTVGSEMRKYGKASPGFVSWLNAPRLFSGKMASKTEFWREFRRREIYFKNDDDKFQNYGLWGADQFIIKQTFLFPVSWSENSQAAYPGLQLGFETELRQKSLNSLEKYQDISATAFDDYSFDMDRQFAFLPVVSYDHMTIDNLFLHGYLAQLKTGFVKNVKEDKVIYKHSFETVLAQRYFDANFLFHEQSLFSTRRNDLSESYFVGGFDAVRGVPDGLLYGHEAHYMNMEWRQKFSIHQYLDLQTNLFCDAALVRMERKEDKFLEKAYSFGGGLRFSVPQVYRLVIRLDYAWAKVGEKNNYQGLSFGMNQYFDPYKPL